MNDNPHANHRSRIRQRYINNGIGAFAEHEILELLLFYCYPRCDTNKIAHRLVNEYGSLHDLMDADVKDIMNRCKVSENVAVLINLVPSLASVYFRGKWRAKPFLDDEKKAGMYCISLFIDSTAERFYLLSLDTQRRLNYVSLITEGTLNETAVYPRQIVSEALKHHATAVILAHNHPGGAITPSRKDMTATAKIVEGLDFIGISVLDHIVVAGEKYYSFSARGHHVKGY
jgi:DNA repair protein RadC